MPDPHFVTRDKLLGINLMEPPSGWVVMRVLLSALVFLMTPGATHAQVSFFTPPTYAGYGNLFVADFNGDGKPDLLSADGTMQLGNGSGTFTTGTPVAGTPLAVADFNGDGKPDVLEQGLGTLLVLLGNGDGTFQAPISTNSGASLYLATTDLNNDGKADVVGVSNTTLLVYLSKGDGTFQPGVPYNLGAGSADTPSITFGDFNGDGKTDVAVNLPFNNVPGEIVVLLGNGDGSLQPTPKISTSILWPGSTIAGDFNRDGKLDLVISASNTNAPIVSVLLGNGDGFFQAPTTVFSGSGTLAAADLNGDGKLDLIFYSVPLLEVYLGKGDGTFSTGRSYMTAIANPWSQLAVADFNLDGKVDVAAGNCVLLSNGDGTLQGQPVAPLPYGPNDVVVGDFDKNGTLDVAATVSGYQSVYILANDGTGALTLVHTYALRQTCVGIATTDLNGDGILDLIVVGSDPNTGNWSYSVLLGNGDGSFQQPVFYPQGVQAAGSFSIIVADFNHDHKADVAISQGPNQSLAVLFGNGDGTFALPVYYFDGGGTVLMTADFNGDGNLDIAAGGFGLGGPQTALLLGNGDGTFKTASFALGAYEAILTADFNNDGKADLISNNRVQVLLGNGDGTFNPLPPWKFDYFGGGVLALTTDINGDGKLDMVGYENVGSQGKNQGVYLGNGDGTFGPFTVVINGAFVMNEGFMGIVQTADMNQDGKPDLVVGETSGNSGIFVMLNTTIPIPGTSFSPSPVTFPSQAVGTSSGPVPVTLTNTGGVALTVTGVSINGAEANQFSQTNNCSSVPPLETCTIQVTFTPTSVGNAVANLSVTDNATGSPQQVPLSGVGTNGNGQEIGLSIPSGGSNSQTVQAGAMATYTLSIGGNGWSGQVSLSCTGAPTGASCLFPGGATMNVSGSSAKQFNVTVSTMARTRSALIPSGHVPAPWLWAMLAVGLVVLPGSVKAKHAGLQRTGMLTLLLLLLCSCGGGGSSGSSNGTPAGTYPLTVTATAGSVNQSVVLELTVQ